ncbi:uroporphyrinogen decarboxylase [Spirochaetia bacterium]|nr:uroporphyrinogen decarboxylase [Spirochaetia bacterium]
MSKRDLMAKVFKNEKAERVPIGFWFHYAKDELVDGFKNPEIFDINIAGHRKFYNEFKPDFVKIMTDGYFIYPNEPFIGAEKASDLRKVKPLGEKHEWIEKQVAFAKTLTGFFGSEVMSFYNLFAPATLFRFARLKSGKANKSLTDFIVEDKDAVACALDAAAQDLAALARRVIGEGRADGVYYSTQDLNDSRVSEDVQEKIVTPADYKVLEGANSAGRYNILHICGYEGCRNNLARYADYPAQIINWATVVEQVSLAEGKKIFRGKPVIGGFDNTVKGVLYRGGKAEIEAETERLLKEAGAVGVVLGADCTIPQHIDLHHLQWVRDKAASFS